MRSWVYSNRLLKILVWISLMSQTLTLLSVQPLQIVKLSTKTEAGWIWLKGNPGCHYFLEVWMRMQKGHMEIKRQWKSLALSFHLLVSGGLNTGHLVWQKVSSPVNPSPQLGRSFVLPTPVVLVQCRVGGSWLAQLEGTVLRTGNEYGDRSHQVSAWRQETDKFWAPFTCPLYSTWAPSL